jgi:hypothetical protein
MKPDQEVMSASLSVTQNKAAVANFNVLCKCVSGVTGGNTDCEHIR